MPIYERPGSPYWWIYLERPSQPPIRLSSKIRVRATSKEQTRENRRLAEAAYDALMGDLARKRFKLPGASGRTFAQQAAWCLKHVTPTHKGARQEAHTIQQLVDAFGSLALAELTPARWAEYTKRRLTDDGVRLNTVGKELTVLKGILNSAVGDWLEVSPLLAVRRKSEKVPPKRTITREEEPAFLEALQAEGVELHDLYIVGVGTLLRQENLINLRRHAHRGQQLVVDTKTGPLQIPLRAPSPLQRRAAEVLARRMPATRDGLFFPEWSAHFAAYTDPGHPRVQFLRQVKRAATAADIPWGIRAGGIVWHTATRATGATRLLRDYKVDIRTVQLIGGWTSLDQMMRYLGIDRTVIEDQYR